MSEPNRTEDDGDVLRMLRVHVAVGEWDDGDFGLQVEIDGQPPIQCPFRAPTRGGAEIIASVVVWALQVMIVAQDGEVFALNRRAGEARSN